MALKSKPYRNPVSVVGELHALADSNPEQALEKARELIATGGSTVRATAAYVLGKLGDASDLPALMEAKRLDVFRTASMRAEQRDYKSPFAGELNTALKRIKEKTGR